MDEQLQQVIAWALPAALGLLVAVGTWLSAAVRSKVKGEAIVSLLERVERLAGAVVLELDQVMVEPMKAAAADGKLNKKTADEIARTALDRLQKMLGERGMLELDGAFGDGLRLLRTMLEAQVSKQRAGKPMKLLELSTPGEGGSS